MKNKKLLTSIFILIFIVLSLDFINLFANTGTYFEGGEELLVKLYFSELVFIVISTIVALVGILRARNNDTSSALNSLLLFSSVYSLLNIVTCCATLDFIDDYSGYFDTSSITTPIVLMSISLVLSSIARHCKGLTLKKTFGIITFGLVLIVLFMAFSENSEGMSTVINFLIIAINILGIIACVRESNTYYSPSTVRPRPYTSSSYRPSSTTTSRATVNTSTTPTPAPAPRPTSTSVTPKPVVEPTRTSSTLLKKDSAPAPTATSSTLLKKDSAPAPTATASKLSKTSSVTSLSKENHLSLSKDEPRAQAQAPVANAASGDVAKQLRTIKQLLDDKIITEAEYAALKEKYLKQL